MPLFASSPWLRRSALAAALAAAPVLSAQTASPPMVRSVPTEGAAWFSFPLFTVGEVVNGYQPPGILDGIGALRLDDQTYRFYVNHELGETAGYPYGINQGRLLLTGARVSYFDVDRRTLRIVHADNAYSAVVDRYGRLVTQAPQINEGTSLTAGFSRFCSSALFPRGTYGLEDDLYLTGEETGDGQLFALDVRNERIHAVPAAGRAAFENVAFVDTGNPQTVGMLIGDDREGAPLYLYVGRKNAQGSGSLLDRNGLAAGKLFVWVAEGGARSPQDFNGTNATRAGRFVRIQHLDPAMAGSPGYDAAGYASMATQDALADAAGAFRFSRPEDLATNPANGRQVAFASTGRGGRFPADNWGTTYLVSLTFGANDAITASLRIVYDGDDAGAGQFPHPDHGLRSPDNLDWARDGRIYIQEDKSTDPGSLFGSVSRQEASVWSLDPASGRLERIARIDRSAVPAGQTDAAPTDLGNWETSGVLDVGPLFGLPAPLTLLMIDTQAHSLRDGVIASNRLVEGGQLGFLLGVRGAGPLAQALQAAQPASLVDALAIIDGQAVDGEDGAGAAVFGFEGAQPNPVTTTTRVRFGLAEAAPVRLTVYDVLGREVAVLVDDARAAGSHEVTFDATALPAGVYALRLSSAGSTRTLRVTVTR